MLMSPKAFGLARVKVLKKADELINQYLLVIVNNVNISLHVLSQISFIVFRERLDLEFQIASIIASVFSGIYLRIAFYKLVEIHNASKIFVKSLTRYYRVSTGNTKLLAKSPDI